MRILLDHNTPAPLRYWLIGHEVETAYECGWAELANGALLAMAEQAGFDALITTDKSIRYQQNLTGRKLGTDCYQHERLDSHSHIQDRRSGSGFQDSSRSVRRSNDPPWVRSVH